MKDLRQIWDRGSVEKLESLVITALLADSAAARDAALASLQKDFKSQVVGALECDNQIAVVLRKPYATGIAPTAYLCDLPAYAKAEGSCIRL